SCRPWLAMTAGSYPGVGTDKKSQVLEEERVFGKQVDAVKTYHTAGQVLDSTDLYFVNRANTFLMANWKPVSGAWSQASPSNHTATATQNIDAMAKSIKAVAPHKIFLTVWHEPENDVGSGTTCTTLKGSNGTPTDYVNMWHYVRQRFDA